MCGIAGIIGGGGHRAEMARMLEVLRHRGPDAGGLWSDDAACLGMRRLSIIDLATGDQPMLGRAADVCLVFNGEIYNYLELRDALRARGHRFRTASDTEVLLRTYLEHGPDCLGHLRGMFAFAIWDGPRRRLFLARDRLGKKPLYYGWRGDEFVFASELKALLALPGVRTEIDRVALAQYFRWQYVPSPRTIFEDFAKLPPATALVLENGTVRTWRYWSPPFEAAAKVRIGPAEALDRLRRHLTESVRLRMRSDVPVGVLLSGGVDSAVITALMTREASQHVQTFSIGFADGGWVDESGAARAVARHLGTDHHELMVEGEAVELLPTVVYHLDEPFADPAALPTYQIASLARRAVKVVLTGEGADELFAGYRSIRALYYTAPLERLPGAARRALAVLGCPVDLVPGGMPARIARTLRSLPDDLETRLRRSASVFDGRAHAELLAPSWPAIAAAGGDRVPQPDRSKVADPLNWLMAALTASWLPDDLLMKVDKMTMAVGLEARTPYLDHRLVEFVARLPAWYKTRPWSSKFLLRQLALELLPPHVAGRRKHGFDVPLDAWFRGALRPMLLDTLESRAIRQAGLIDPGVARRIADDHLAERGNHGRQLWALLCFQLWYDRFMAGRAGDAPREADSLLV